jgi:hypothetical protein
VLLAQPLLAALWCHYEYLVSSMVARCRAWRIKGDIIE